MKRALITGITGQDGSYLAELLLGKGYSVTGISNSGALIPGPIEFVEGDIQQESLIKELVSKQFDEIYNLASISTVQSPWENPVETVTSCGLVPLMFLEAIKTSSPHTKFFQASSAEMFGDPEESPQTETTPFSPRNPYGYGKLLAHEAVEGYRTNNKLFAVSGILFNHESPRRGLHFVTRKITSTLARIVAGSNELLELGNLDAKRDWSFAGDVVNGMWLSLQSEKADSYVFASGEVHTVREFVEAVAEALDVKIEWQGEGVEEKGLVNGKAIVSVNPQFFRPLETQVRCGNPEKAKKELGWQLKTSFKDLASMMVEGEKSEKKS